MRSLRTRAIFAGLILAVVFAITITLALVSYLNRQATDRFDRQLESMHVQLAVAVANAQGDEARTAAQMPNILFSRPFSGTYWQAIRNDGLTLVSRSLADQLLRQPTQPSPQATISTDRGPRDQELRMISQLVSYQGGSEWLLQVGMSTEPIRVERRELLFRVSLVVLLAIGISTFGTTMLVFFTLKPLSELREEVSARWKEEGELTPDLYPTEIQPLVQDINTLLNRNRQIVDRSRRHAADLAHAVKTPSSILRNELADLDQRDIDVSAAYTALDRLDAQLTRSFARLRSGQGSLAEAKKCPVTEVTERMGRAFSRMAENKDMRLEIEIAPDLSARISRQDLEEILGNLLDNALKFGETMARLTAKFDGDVVICVEDDGPGVPHDARRRVLEPEVRLDESKPGTGIGLTIVSDIVQAYGGAFDIGASDGLGGAKATLRLNAARETRLTYSVTGRYASSLGEQEGASTPMPMS